MTEKELNLTKAQNAVLSHDWGTAARLYKLLLKDDDSNITYLKVEAYFLLQFNIKFATQTLGKIKPRYFSGFILHSFGT